MTVLEALGVLEAATVECKKRNINTPDVRAALDLLEPHIQPMWLIPQFRHHALKNRGDDYLERALRATFPAIRDSVKELIGTQMDVLERKFAATHDMKVKEKIDHLAAEYAKLKQRWVFVSW
ncbi:MAG TPA: hypothetical protein VI585_18550 [Candidatus Binatia bacterium]